MDEQCVLKAVQRDSDVFLLSGPSRGGARDGLQTLGSTLPTKVKPLMSLFQLHTSVHTLITRLEHQLAKCVYKRHREC